MAKGTGNRLTGSTGRLRRERERVAQQWAEVRAEIREREVREPEIAAGPSNFSRAQVPWGLDLAAAWSWRFLVIAAAGLAILWTLRTFAVVTMPLAIALLVTALVTPAVSFQQRLGIPRPLAAIGVVITGIGLIALLITFVSQQVIDGFSDLTTQVVDGLEKIRTWLREGPLQASDSQINDVIREVQRTLTDSNQELVKRATEVGTTLGHVVAGAFLALFATYFFLADGARIWAWVVRLFPRAARGRADTSGRIAWRSLTQFVRATVLVAAVDSVGIMIAAAILDVPLVSAIGVVVFLGAFIPIIGAFLSGSVAVLVALVAQGPVVALLMLLGVLVVQQIESHILQPFLMGRFVSVHPLGVLVAIGTGVLVAGVAGALVAVPLVAAVNAVALHLASQTEVGEDPLEGTVDDDDGAVGDEVDR